jgi:hypothetical protein
MAEGLAAHPGSIWEAALYRDSGAHPRCYCNSRPRLRLQRGLSLVRAGRGPQPRTCPHDPRIQPLCAAGASALTHKSGLGVIPRVEVWRRSSQQTCPIAKFCAPRARFIARKPILSTQLATSPNDYSRSSASAMRHNFSRAPSSKSLNHREIPSGPANWSDVGEGRPCSFLIWNTARIRFCTLTLSPLGRGISTSLASPIAAGSDRQAPSACEP